MNDTKLQKKLPTAVKETGQYVLAFGVIASMLLVTGFPVFVIFFFGIFAYFLLKMFASGSRNETREIFEFYLSANEILRDDERKWFGFEIKEAILRGESIIKGMSGAPPLVYFTLGALYNKIGDHKAAVNNLSFVLENEDSDESKYAFPSPELRSYVKVLRKIERDPADAPLTSASVRALERARKLRGKILLEESRTKFAHPAPAELKQAQAASDSTFEYSGNGKDPSERRSITDDSVSVNNEKETSFIETTRSNHRRSRPNSARKEKADPFANRKPITEVLHDIYDKNVQ